jgi:hypothetical protein
MVKTLNMVRILGDIKYGSEVVDVHSPIDSAVTRFHDDWGIAHNKGPFVLFAAIVVFVADAHRYFASRSVYVWSQFLTAPVNPVKRICGYK